MYSLKIVGICVILVKIQYEYIIFVCFVSVIKYWIQLKKYQYQYHNRIFDKIINC